MSTLTVAPARPTPARLTPARPTPARSAPRAGQHAPAARTAPSTPVRPAVLWRRRATVLLGLVALAFLLTVAIGRVGAQADLDNRVAGHVVLEPGQTLWDVAVDTAPPGVDVRAHLAEIRELNGFAGTHTPAWTVVLLPAR